MCGWRWLWTVTCSRVTWWNRKITKQMPNSRTFLPARMEERNRWKYTRIPPWWPTISCSCKIKMLRSHSWKHRRNTNVSSSSSLLATLKNVLNLFDMVKNYTVVFINETWCSGAICFWYECCKLSLVISAWSLFTWCCKARCGIRYLFKHIFWFIIILVYTRIREEFVFKIVSWALIYVSYKAKVLIKITQTPHACTCGCWRMPAGLPDEEITSEFISAAATKVVICKNASVFVFLP